MADVHEPDVRSYNMSQIKSKNTKPEMIVRKFLHSNGFRYKLHDKNLPGKPDLVLPKYKTVIFVNGCFWHMHSNCDFFKLPKSRKVWWRKKLEGNVKRDHEYYRKLLSTGWRVFVIWSCNLKPSKKEKYLNELQNFIIDPKGETFIC